MRPAVFLDRDGVIIEDRCFLSDPRDIRLYPGSREALRALREAGFWVIVVTNQSGVARGTFSEARLLEIHCRLAELLGDGRPHAFFYCPHHPEDGCVCRKPRPGLFYQAARNFPIQRKGSWAIGDRPRDLWPGFMFGARTILVRTGHGREHKLQECPPGTREAVDLREAVHRILRMMGEVPRAWR